MFFTYLKKLKILKENHHEVIRSYLVFVSRKKNLPQLNTTQKSSDKPKQEFP